MGAAGPEPPASVLDDGASFEQALTLLAAGTLGLTVLWLVLVTVATVVEGLCGVSSAAVRALTPVVLRRVVLVCCGVAAGAGVLSPAGAVSGAVPGAVSGAVSQPAAEAEQETARPHAGAVLSGLPLPDRPLGGPPRARDRATVARPEPAVPRYRVRPGDSLWHIAERHLVSTPSLAEVDAAWRRLYHANRDVVGDDPDHLPTGAWLALPTDRDPRPPRDADSSPS